MSSPQDRAVSRAELFEMMGGHATFSTLVSAFYEGVRHDDLLAPMYPDDDMTGAEDRLRTFLEQYWGGPTTYSEQRGHPRLRMRHAPFDVTPEARDRWLIHMRSALDSIDLPPEQEALLWDYLKRAAFMLVNRMESP